MAGFRRATSVFKLFTDGASRGNPGRAATGAALYSNDHILQAHLSCYVGHHTSNVAEYLACLHGLRMARMLRVPRVVVLSDSQLMVRHLHGTFAVRNDRLKVLHATVLQLAAQFALCRFAYIPRERNVFADALATRALQPGARDTFVLDQPFISLAVGGDRRSCDDTHADPHPGLVGLT